jgi:segregation and condensation protein A
MSDAFETTMSADLATDERALIVDVEGFEGPLDLLLSLARQQKVDLAKISVLALAQRLQRLEAIRIAADQLNNRPQLGREVFARGAPEPIADIKRPEWTATLYDLLTAYATQRQKSALSHVRFAKRTVWSLSEARDVLTRMIGASYDWSRLDQYLISYVVEPAQRATAMASSFAVVLEMVREGQLDVNQSGPFAPIFLRKRAGDTQAGVPAGA